ncbi:MAG: PAS domain S-box protein, partial [Humidesulfovibrio sp.]|nr:PAS domain S-box protein [Humidesulfovibrio sp.]
MSQDALGGAGGVPLSADILGLLLNASQDVLYAVALNPVRMLYATPAFAQRMGLVKDFLAKGYPFSEYLTAVHPDDLDRVAGVMAAITASRSDDELPENPASYRLRTPEGGWRVISDTYSILRGADGVPHTLIGNARDVSERSHAQQTLKERDARFRLLAENSRDLFFSMRFPEGRFEFLSPSVESLFGISTQEFYHDPKMLLRCIAPDWRATVQGWLAGIAQGAVAESYEFQVVDKAGRLRWLNQRQVLVPTPDGQGMLLQGVATDVTDLREAQQALADNEARFRSLAENSRDTFFSFRVSQSRYEVVSANVADLLGHSAREFYEDAGLFMRCVAPQWRERKAAWNAEIVRGQVRDRYEFEVLDAQGSLRWVVERLVLVPAPDGQGMLLQGVLQDITEERGAREALRESEEHFRQLIEAWPEQVMLRVNLTRGCHEYVSPSMERVLGYAPQEFYDDPGLGMRVVAPQWLDQATQWIAELRQGIVRPGYEFELVRKNGQHRWVHQVGVLRPRAPGQDLLVQFTFRDITEERAARKALRQSEERYRELAEGWLSQAVIRINLNTNRYEYVSPGMEKLFGFAPEEFYRGERGIVGRTVAPEWRETVQEWMADARRGHLLPEYEFELIDAWGARRWVRQHCTLLHGADGAPEVVQGVLYDNTERHLLENELQASKAFLDCVIEQSPMSMWISDEKGTLIRSNQALRKLFQVSEEEIVGRFNIFQDNQVQEHGFMPQIRRVHEQGGTTRFTLPYDTASIQGLTLSRSAKAFLDVTISAVQNAQGKTTNLIVQHQDVSEQKRTEEALRESNARYAILAENVVDVIWTTDENLRWTYLSPSAERLSGVPLGQLITLPFEKLFTPESMLIIGGLMARRQAADPQVNSDEAYRAEMDIRHVDGTLVPLEVLVRPIRGPDGAITGYCGTSRDITERKQAEEALLASERRFSELIRYSSDSITILDKDGSQVFVSEAVERMLGFKASELMGIPVIEEMIHPDDREKVEAAFAVILKEGMGGAQYRHMHKNGSWVYLEAWGTNQLENPDIRGVVVNVRDITERRQAEAALRLSEARYALALKGANDGIWDWDLVQDQVYYSDRWKQIIGYGPDEIQHVADEWTSRIHPQDYDQVMAANQSCIRGEAPIFQVEYRLRHKDGSYRWIYGRGATLADATGRVVRMAGAHTDITARKQAEEALFKNERLSRKLLESMHEGIWAVDADRRTTFVNERLCAMLGYASAELMYMSPTDVLEWPQRHVAKSQLSDLEAGFTGATDYVLIRKDGSRFPAHVVSSPVMEEQGRFEGLVCGVVDLTERARMEHELRRNQARFEALYELSRLTPATEHQLASFTLREAIRLTDSSAGVLFFVSQDAQHLEPKAWETSAFEEAAGQVPCFPTSGTQPWAMVAQSGLPLLINDFSQCAHLVPPEHPPISRLLGVPALDGTRAAAVLGLTGKEEPYTAEDTLHVTLLLDGMWREVRTRRDEERIRASLREKEALLHEVHHRVKNNLQVISSLMDMAGRRLGSAEARMSLKELRGKVLAMSLIHAQLHGAGSGGGISLERFVRALFQ